MICLYHNQMYFIASKTTFAILYIKFPEDPYGNKMEDPYGNKMKQYEL